MINLILKKFSLHPLLVALILLALLTGQWTQMVTLFGIILFHEWGHLFWARYFDWQIERILLFPFGGVMEISSPLLPSAREEAIVVLGGPLNQFLLLLIVFFMHRIGLIDGAWSRFLFEGNLLLLLFNLLPLYPLDGGRIIQLISSFFLPYRRAILFTLYLGGVLYLLLLALTFFGWMPTLSLWLLLPYLLHTSYLEARHLPYRIMKFLLVRYLHGVKRGLALKVLPVPPEESLRRAAFQMYRYRYHLFHVKLPVPSSESPSFTEGGIEGNRGVRPRDKGKLWGRRTFYLREERLLTEIFAKKNPFLPIGRLESKEDIPD